MPCRSDERGMAPGVEDQHSAVPLESFFRDARHIFIVGSQEHLTWFISAWLPQTGCQDGWRNEARRGVFIIIGKGVAVVCQLV